MEKKVISLDGLQIDAFYDADGQLMFAVDSTRDAVLPNTMLILDARDDRKWDDILENDFHIKPETIRPKHNNKYQKLDISYDGLIIYANAIKTKNAAALRDWRITATERQMAIRQADARRDKQLAEATVAEAVKTLGELNELITIQSEKLKDAREEIGTIPPKQSAAKILALEHRIEKAQAKRARTLRRLKRAEKRIDSADRILHNQNTKPIRDTGEIVMNDEIQPLFTTKPDMIDSENAFKPVSFAPPSFTPPPPPPVAEPVAPVDFSAPPVAEPSFAPEPLPAFNPAPVPPVQKIDLSDAERPTTSGAYYLMLMMLIGLSVFTLYLYQKKMNPSELPHIQAVVPEPVPMPDEVAEPAEAGEQPAGTAPEEIIEIEEDDVFLEQPEEPVRPVGEVGAAE